MGVSTESGPQTLEQALKAAQRAIALNDSFPLAHMVLGHVYLWQKQYEQAVAEMERAIALDPNSGDGYAVLAEGLSRVGRSEEALRWWSRRCVTNPAGCGHLLLSQHRRASII